VSLITKYAFRGNCTATGDNGDVKIEGPCYSCSRPVAVTVKVADYRKFEGGKFAQDCFPYLSAEQREFLISGICSACWDEMFPPEER
jgi:hypothetical protein